MNAYTLLPTSDRPGTPLAAAVRARRQWKRPQLLLAYTGGAVVLAFLLIRLSMALSGKITSSYPPTYERLWQYERRLPQHNLQLPLPEGRNGRYVRFANQVRQKGWNNVLNEILICTEVAHEAKRAYVFEHFTWLPRHYPWALYPWQRGLSWGPRTPLSALIAGPTVGGTWDENDDAPRSVSVEYWNQVCPPSDRYYISRRTALEGLGPKPEGAAVFDRLVRLVRDAPARCVEVGRVGEDPTFDVWLISGNRSLSLSERFLDAPSSRLLHASPLVKGAVIRNEYLFAPRSPALAVPIDLQRRSATPKPDVFARMMAIHLRRGDFKGACRYHTNRPDVWYQWNLWPTHPDKFVPPPGVGGGYAPPEAYEAVRKRCFPNQEEIVERIRTVRAEYLRTSPATGAVLDTMHIMTNGDAAWVAELKQMLSLDGWDTVVSSAELKLDDEQTDVSMAVDMEIGRRAAVFVGNGWSSLTSNIVHQRLVDKRHPYATRFW